MLNFKSFFGYDLYKVTKPKFPADGQTNMLLRLILLMLMQQTESTEYTTGKITVSGPGTIENIHSVTFIIHADDATINGDLCEADRSYSYSAPKGGTLAPISYDSGNGNIEILTVA